MLGAIVQGESLPHAPPKVISPPRFSPPPPTPSPAALAQVRARRCGIWTKKKTSTKNKKMPWRVFPDPGAISETFSAADFAVASFSRVSAAAVSAERAALRESSALVVASAHVVESLAWIGLDLFGLLAEKGEREMNSGWFCLG